MHDTSLVPAHTEDKEATKQYPPLHVRSTVSKTLAQVLMTILVSIPINNPIPDATNNTIDSNEAFKTILFNINETYLLWNRNCAPSAGGPQ